MDNKKILIVGGTFNNEGGCPSVLVDKLFAKIEGAMIINGGLVDFLKSFVEEGIKDYKIVFWIPEKAENIPTTNDIRNKNPKCFIIDSILNKKDSEVKESSAKDTNMTLNISETEDGQIKISGVSSYGDVIFEECSLENAAEMVANEKILSQATHKKYIPAPEQVISMERLHLRVSENCIDILYRPNHNYLAFVPNDENGKAEVKRLAEMSREDFAEYLKTRTGLPRLTKTDIPNIKSSKSEEWFLGAWKMQTDKLLEELKISNPIEEPIWRE